MNFLTLTAQHFKLNPIEGKSLLGLLKTLKLRAPHSFLSVMAAPATLRRSGG